MEGQLKGIKAIKIFLFMILSVFVLTFVSADWYFYGHVYDANGNALYNATINITFWTMSPGSPPALAGYNSSTSNQTGWFNFSVTANESYFYKPVVQHFEENKTDGSTPIDYVGQSLPHFPFPEFNGIRDLDFYLREAGTINITAVNATGSPKNFQYIVKDTKLGYPIAEGFGNYVSQAIVYVPRDRNYTIQIFPNESMPVSYHWNNFSSTNDLNISTPSNNINLSSYNATTHTLHKQFNCTENLVWVSGYALNLTGEAPGYDEFTVIPFILEAGNMVYLGENAAMPYNMSAWRGGGATDNYSLSTGFYNITLPGTAESATYILFATARNGNDYYGGYRNISLNYSSSDEQVNFTMYKLMATTGWASSTSNITMNDATTWQNVNISTARQQFNLVNASNNQTLSMSAHIEVTVDYSNYNATEFTFMTDISSGNASFYIPLLNASVKEINVFSQAYAPRRVEAKTASQILANNNISMWMFNPGGIEEDIAEANIFIELHKSNSTCNVPSPDGSCQIGAFGPDENQLRNEFNPLSAVIGGGKLNFRMGYSGIEVVYINVDMLASGPPDAEFDSSVTELMEDGFSAAVRFGSMGPTIYDYVLVGLPYTQGSTSQTGLNENADVNISIPYFYDENWNVIWNTATNGTNGTLLAGNYSHYSTYSDEWETLMGNNTCITNQSAINSTNPCYIDTTNNRIWIRLPHFSGTQPRIIGNVITATTSEEEYTGGIASSLVNWSKQKIHQWAKITPGVATIMKDFDEDVGVKQIQIEVNNEARNVKITVRKYDSKPAQVSVGKEGKVYQYLQIEEENLGDKLDKAILTIRVEKNWTEENNIDKENVSLFKFDETSEKWDELVTTYTEEDDTFYYYDAELTSFSYFAIGEKVLEQIEEEKQVGEEITEIVKKNLILWIVIAFVILVAIVWIIIAKRRKQQ